MAIVSFTEQKSKLNYAGDFKSTKKIPTSTAIPLNHFNTENDFSGMFHSIARSLTDINKTQELLTPDISDFVLHNFSCVTPWDDGSCS